MTLHARQLEPQARAPARSTRAAHARLRRIFARFETSTASAWHAGAATLSYHALWRQAGALARRLAAHDVPGPVIIWNHKDAAFAVAYWACLLSGRTIVPVEADTPPDRLAAIARTCGAGLLLNAHSAAPDGTTLTVINPGDTGTAAALLPDPDDDDIAYILFSSGTSGAPKGIRITYANLVHFIDWLSRDLLGATPLAAVSGNVRHCFDVSLFELWAAWTRLIPVSAMMPDEFLNSRRYIQRYGDHGVGLWVSTPTAIAAYLRDPQFTGAALPRLRTFLFCGEVLPKQTVALLMERFPGARIVNTYGPTECTVAVTATEIDRQMLEDPVPLPIGTPRPGVSLHSDQGEIVIGGACVGPGYIGLPDRQSAAFPAPQMYRTGDRGLRDASGQWHFQGRADREVKIQGVRLDLAGLERDIADLAARLTGRSPGVVVEPHVIRGTARGMQVSLGGLVDAGALADLAAQFASTVAPQAMPRHWFGCAETPLGPGGKLDRNRLQHMARKGWSHVCH